MKKIRLILSILLILIPSNIMEINARGLQIIKDMEGLKTSPYICPAGVLTIGYGHTKSVKGAITAEKAEELLKQDLKFVDATISTKVKVPLNENQYSALASFIFNVGHGAFSGSTMLRLLNQGKYEEAAKQFDRWVFAGGKKLAGLEKRRRLEKELFLA